MDYKKFKELAQPLIEFLNEQGDPHSKIIVTQQNAFWTQDQMSTVREKNTDNDSVNIVLEKDIASEIRLSEGSITITHKPYNRQRW